MYCVDQSELNIYLGRVCAEILIRCHQQLGINVLTVVDQLLGKLSTVPFLRHLYIVLSFRELL